LPEETHNDKAKQDMASQPAAQAPSERDSRFRPEAERNRTATREFGDVLKNVNLTPSLSNPLRTLKNYIIDLKDGLGKKKIPIRTQTHGGDCGPACLSMVLAYHGIEPDPDRLREEVIVGRNGVSARSLLDAGRRHGLIGRGVKCTIGGLKGLPPGSILFWNFQHFVVLERVAKRGMHIVDPAFGRRRVSFEIANKAFTGIALEFLPQVSISNSSRSMMRSGKPSDNPWRHLRYFFPREKAWVPLLISSLLLISASFAVPIATEYFADHVTRAHSLHGFARWVPVVAILSGLFLALQIVRSFSVGILQAIGDKQATLKIFEHLLSLPYDYFQNRSTGDLVTRVRTSTQVRQVLTTSALSALFDGSLILVYMTLLVLLDWILALVVIGLAIADVVVLAVGWRRQDWMATDALEVQAKSQGELVELIDAMPALKAAGMEGAVGERWTHTLIDEINARTSSTRNVAMLAGIGTSIQFSAPLIVLVVGALRVTSGSDSLGKVLAFSSLSIGLFFPLAGLVQSGLLAASLGASLRRMGEIIRTAPENAAGSLIGMNRVSGSVELRNVDFAYPGSTLNVLNDLALEFQKGEFVAVMGGSGSGKSTLAMMIAGLYLPTSGQVLIDGIATHEMDRSSLRRSISYISQSNNLFAGTIIENIMWGNPEATIKDVVKAAELAEIHSDISRMRMGYSTLLGPAGAGLSGGQKQRVILARALLRKSKLLILDEATSALDSTVESRIFDNLLGCNLTLITVAHRLPIRHKPDRIVVLEKGSIASISTNGAPPQFID
jgi:ATP-binding cassette, subfamily B, bacterial